MDILNPALESKKVLIILGPDNSGALDVSSIMRLSEYSDEVTIIGNGIDLVSEDELRAIDINYEMIYIIAHGFSTANTEHKLELLDSADRTSKHVIDLIKKDPEWPLSIYFECCYSGAAKKHIDLLPVGSCLFVASPDTTKQAFKQISLCEEITEYLQCETNVGERKIDIFRATMNKMSMVFKKYPSSVVEINFLDGSETIERLETILFSDTEKTFDSWYLEHVKTLKDAIKIECGLTIVDLDLFKKKITEPTVVETKQSVISDDLTATPLEPTCQSYLQLIFAKTYIHNNKNRLQEIYEKLEKKIGTDKDKIILYRLIAEVAITTLRYQSSRLMPEEMLRLFYNCSSKLKIDGGYQGSNENLLISIDIFLLSNDYSSGALKPLIFVLNEVKILSFLSSPDDKRMPTIFRSIVLSCWYRIDEYNKEAIFKLLEYVYADSSIKANINDNLNNNYLLPTLLSNKHINSFQKEIIKKLIYLAYENHHDVNLLQNFSYRAKKEALELAMELGYTITADNLSSIIGDGLSILYEACDKRNIPFIIILLNRAKELKLNIGIHRQLGEGDSSSSPYKRFLKLALEFINNKVSFERLEEETREELKALVKAVDEYQKVVLEDSTEESRELIKKCQETLDIMEKEHTSGNVQPQQYIAQQTGTVSNYRP